MTKRLGLDDFTGPFRPSGDELNYRTCPVCRDARWKVFLNADSGFWICFAGACGARGRVHTDRSPDALLRDLRPGPAEVPAWPEIELPPFTRLSSEGRDYLAQRGFDEAACKLYQVVTPVEHPGRVCIPYLNRDGAVIYWSLRDWTGEARQKYLNKPGRKPLYVPSWAYPAGRATRTPRYRMVLVEGALDAIRVDQADALSGAGYLAVALGGKSLPRYLRRFLLELVDFEVTVLLDADALGAAMRLAMDLRGHRQVRVCTLPAGTDPASTTPDKLAEVLR